MSSSVKKLYVQSLDAPLPIQDTQDIDRFRGKIEHLSELIDDADAVVVGVGSGLSTASGYDFYHGSNLFDEAFEVFIKAYGFKTLFDGMYHLFSDNEQQWAFNAAAASFVSALPVGRPYQQLARILEDKDHFVITTNVDGQIPRVFDRGRYWLFQGDMRFMQCSQPCDEEVIFDQALIEHLISATYLDADGAPRVPSDLMPRCSYCHRLMVPWVRDTSFLEGDLWLAQKAAYETFLTQYLAQGSGKVLFLELGVSSMTPSIIKMPFWDMVIRNPNAQYVEVNCAEQSTPLQLGDRATVITADLALVMQELEKQMRR